MGIGCLTCSSNCLSNCPGYYLEGGICVTKCGDDIVISEFEECDDGNNHNGDGCNSHCLVETNYNCLSAGTGSLCSYILPIDLILKQFTKDPTCNCLNFTLELNPDILSLTNLDFLAAITPSLPLFNGSFTYHNGVLILSYEYADTLEYSDLTFYFMPSSEPGFFETPGSTTSIELVLPSNEPIVVYDGQVY